jgi:hypothetical protein
MNTPRMLACTICGETRQGSQPWFLLSEDCWQDRLRILHWDDYLATLEGTHCACSAAHLEELVVHWMTTGSLDHPFARVYSWAEVLRRQRRVGWTARNDFGSHTPKPIGELTVHRESMRRVLSENPQSLRTILDALLIGLRAETSTPEPALDWDCPPRQHVQRDM